MLKTDKEMTQTTDMMCCRRGARMVAESVNDDRCRKVPTQGPPALTPL